MLDKIICTIGVIAAISAILFIVSVGYTLSYNMR